MKKAKIDRDVTMFDLTLPYDIVVEISSYLHGLDFLNFCVSCPIAQRISSDIRFMQRKAKNDIRKLPYAFDSYNPFKIYVLEFSRKLHGNDFVKYCERFQIIDGEFLKAKIIEKLRHYANLKRIFDFLQKSFASSTYPLNLYKHIFGMVEAFSLNEVGELGVYWQLQGMYEGRIQIQMRLPSFQGGWRYSFKRNNVHLAFDPSDVNPLYIEKNISIFAFNGINSLNANIICIPYDPIFREFPDTNKVTNFREFIQYVFNYILGLRADGSLACQSEISVASVIKAFTSILSD